MQQKWKSDNRKREGEGRGENIWMYIIYGCNAIDCTIYYTQYMHFFFSNNDLVLFLLFRFR